MCGIAEIDCVGSGTIEDEMSYDELKMACRHQITEAIKDYVKFVMDPDGQHLRGVYAATIVGLSHSFEHVFGEAVSLSPILLLDAAEAVSGV